jgi:hypothetical protein
MSAPYLSCRPLGSDGSGRDLREEGLNFRNLPRVEAELGRPGHAPDLAGPPRAFKRRKDAVLVDEVVRPIFNPRTELVLRLQADRCEICGSRSAGKPPAPFDVAGAGNVARGAGLRPTAKAVDEPPDPTVRAPALDPT